jgi:hypothetical protein
MQNSEQGEAQSASRTDDRPDLPQQHFDRSASRTAHAPEKRLMIAVLMNAVLQLRSRDAQDVIEAESWVGGTETTDWPFSFNNICEALDIESSYFARGLLAWRDRPMGTIRRTPLRQVRTARGRVVPSRERRRLGIAGLARAIKKPLPR